MIDLYYWPTPNGHKITIFLEEAGLDYNIIPVNIGAGEQFQPDFLKILQSYPARSHRWSMNPGEIYIQSPTPFMVDNWEIAQ